MTEHDRIRLRHMLEAAREAVSYISERERSDMRCDRMLLHSLVHCIMIIGEAAANVSADCRRQIPAIPWPDIVGMRNRLVHAYFDIDLDLVWNTIEVDIPSLIAALEGLEGIVPPST